MSFNRIARAAAVLLLPWSVPAVAGEAPVPGLATEAVVLPEDLGEIADLGPLVFRGGLTITTPDPKFWGWSGVWVSPDGKELVGVENGRWIKAKLSYDAQGNLSGFDPAAVGALHDALGRELSGEEDTDSEGLDFDGHDFIVGFETNDRVLRYRDIDGPGVPLRIPQTILAPIFRGAGFSSVVALADGSTLAIPEYSYADAEKREYGRWPARGWLEMPHGAGPIALRGAFPAMPVSIAQLPGGDLLTVELRLDGVSATVDEAWIGIVPKEEIAIGNTMTPRQIAKFAPPMPAWRIEGTSARVGDHGETLIYIMTTSTPPRLYMFELPSKESGQ